MTQIQNSPALTSTADLLNWADNLSLVLPFRSDSTPRRVKIAESSLPLPGAGAMATKDIRGLPASRSQGSGAVWIEHLVLTAERSTFRALGLLFWGYALSNQTGPLRLLMSENPNEISQIIVWPTEASELEARLGFRQRVHQISYRPRLFRDNPNYLTNEQLDASYPREHLPHCRPGAWDVEGGGVAREGEPVCAHFRGTAPSLIWLGKYLMDFALDDCNATLAYLYNLSPLESMAPGSAELRLVIANPDHGPRLLPA